MNETNDNLDRLLSLNKDEVQKILSQFSVIEVEDLLDKLNGEDYYD